MGIIRDSFIVFKNFVDAINALPEEYQLETYKALMTYGLNGDIPENLSPVVNAMLISFSKGMETSVARYVASVENGKKGGRPPKAEKVEETENLTEPSQDLQEPSETQENLEKPRYNLDKPSHNLNDNVNVTVNDSKLVNKIKNNKFNKYNITCVRVRERVMEEREPYLKLWRQFFYDGLQEPWLSLGYEVVDTVIEVVEQANYDNFKFNHRTLEAKDIFDIIRKVDCESLRKIVTQLKFNTEIKNRPFYIFGCLYMASQNKNPDIDESVVEQFARNLSQVVQNENETS